MRNLISCGMATVGRKISRKMFPKKNPSIHFLLVNFCGIQWQRIQVAQLKSTQKSSFIFIDHIFVRWRAKQGRSGQKFSSSPHPNPACMLQNSQGIMHVKQSLSPPPPTRSLGRDGVRKNLKVRLLQGKGERTLLTPKDRLARLRFRLLKVFLLVCCLLSLQKEKKK